MKVIKYVLQCTSYEESNFLRSDKMSVVIQSFHYTHFKKERNIILNVISSSSLAEHQSQLKCMIIFYLWNWPQAMFLHYQFLCHTPCSNAQHSTASFCITSKSLIFTFKLERVCSQTQLCQLNVLMTILDNYMFWPLLAIFRFSSRELKVILYIMCVRVMERSLHPGFVA